ncbi:bacteriocin [Lactococcus lactis]|uniref:bacteriocin n=1 Tax=Lactococcus lactis TaxID=1358 RepID=UPI00240E08EE|nr:bacteriocin [Lactococcus lactis]WFB95696.1 bacteriocin [Lactococcus lactis]
MKKDEIIKLSDGQKATIVTGDESSTLSNSYIVKLEDGELRVVDRKTLTLAPAK